MPAFAGMTKEEARPQPLNVTPAKAGAHLYPAVSVERWVPAFAGMTIFCAVSYSGSGSINRFSTLPVMRATLFL